MQFSEGWLREFCNPTLDSEALGHLLTMAGLEVEEAETAAPPFTGVVVGQIVEAVPHPNADKLRLCKVDAGEPALLQVVCGAPNAAAGMKVPFARVGAMLPGGFEIKAAKLRGEESFGMLCSARELGISQDHGGLLALAEDAPVGADVREVLRLDDVRYTIKLTPNRADCLSLTGVAREVAALTGAPLRLPEIVSVPVSLDAERKIVLEAPAACPRYCGRVLAGVDARAPTPQWMRERLLGCGVRSISALVDITNYVMLELGQPLHAFDNQTLQGAIHVRYPRAGDSLLLLNEQSVVPDPDTLLIADEARALAMAGVMGGEASGVTLDTREVFLESAFFAPEAIAGRARSYGFTSDASHRFERGVDFALAYDALERASQLILEICGGQAGPMREAQSAEHLPQRPPVHLRPQRLGRLLGFALETPQILALLRAVHLDVLQEGEDLWVTPPSWRFDIAIEEDLVEEVIRLYGYDKLPAPEPRGQLAMLPVSEAQRTAWTVRHQLAARDFQEVVNYAFVEAAWERDFCANAQPVTLANPIASQMSVMRSSLIGGLVANLAHNRKRQLARVRVFELGRVFAHDPAGQPVEGYAQSVRVAALAAGPASEEQWGLATRTVDFYDLKGDFEALSVPARAVFEPAVHPALHPGRSARIVLAGRAIGFLGELHPRWVQAYELGSAPVVFEVELEPLLQTQLPAYQEISRQPAVRRDLALVLDQRVEAAEVQRCLMAAAQPFVRSIEIFDVYHGKGLEPGKKSLAFRVLMQDTQRTLEDGEVDAAMQELLRAASAGFGAELRA